jgi:hypothetical protein
MSETANHGSVRVTVIRKKKAGGDARPEETFKKEKTGGKAYAVDTKPDD